MKTLALRMERHEANALRVAAWLVWHAAVAHVFYPGLPQHPGHDLHRRQASGAGGMVSFELRDERRVPFVLTAGQVVHVRRKPRRRGIADHVPCDADPP